MIILAASQGTNPEAKSEIRLKPYVESELVPTGHNGFFITIIYNGKVQTRSSFILDKPRP